MKILKLVISILAITVSIGTIAQDLSEKEVKALKKEMLKKAKETDGIELQKMFEEYPKIEGIKAELEKSNTKNKELEKKIANAESNKKGELQALKESFTKERGELFLKSMENKKGVTKTSSGLLYEVLVKGKGSKPSASNTVKVHYTGTFIDGKVFDSSVQRGQPIEFGLGQVIKGWTEGLQLMEKGSKYKLYIPYDLAYGERGRSSIPAYSTLIFEVELIDFK